MSERPVVFSSSSVNAYQECHLRWYFSYILGQEGTQSEAQVVGIAVHDAAEQILRKKLPADAFDAMPPIDGLMKVFARDILPTYRDPVLVEAPFQIEVDGIPFSGIIDSVDRQDVPGPDWSPADGLDVPDHANILRDLKTTGSRPSAGKYRFNMIGYFLGARELGYEIAIMQLDYIVRTKTPYYWPEAQQIPDDDEVAGWAGTLHAAANGVARGDYNPTGLGTRACASCPHKALCGPYQRYQEVTT